MLGNELVFGGSRPGIRKSEFELVDQPPAAFGSLTVKRAAHLRVLQLEQRVARLEIGSDRLGVSGLGPGLGGVRASLGKGVAQAMNSGWKSVLSHVGDIAQSLGIRKLLSYRNDHPAALGRQVWRGLRQSIPSSMHAICEADIATTPSLTNGQMKRPRSSRLA